MISDKIWKAIISVGLLSIALVLAPAVRVAPAVAAGSYTFTTLDYPGALSTHAYGINNAGQIVGAYIDRTGTTYGFLYSGGTFTTITLNIPGVTVTNTNAHGINKSGQIAGDYTGANDAGHGHGFLLSGGTVTTLDYPSASPNSPGFHTGAGGINDSTQIVGRYCDPCFFGIAKGFMYSNGSYQMIPAAPGALPGATDGAGINNGGQIVGSFETGDGRVHGYLAPSISSSPSTWTILDYPGASGTEAYGLNNSGQVVGGDNSGTAGAFRGFLYSGGTFTTIDPPGAVYSIAFGINDSSQIVGFYT
ncbi:MAG: hypothetical protein AUI63_01345, partial [Gemmatimonadetes bacterium 13_1_40CM_2_60_3]